MYSSTAESPADKRRLAQRDALLDAASEMLVHGGPDAISLRKLAARIGTSTMAVYTAFGGKDGLIAALFTEAFNRLAAAEAEEERLVLALVEVAAGIRFSLKL